jgi:hypothetical protein
MSAFGTKRTSQHAGLMSDFGGIANIVREDGWPIGPCERAALAETTRCAWRCKRPRPGETEKHRDSEIANTRGPFGRAERGDHKQDQDRPAANFCAGAKPRFHIGAHRNTPTSFRG